MSFKHDCMKIVGSTVIGKSFEIPLFDKAKLNISLKSRWCIALSPERFRPTLQIDLTLIDNPTYVENVTLRRNIVKEIFIYNAMCCQTGINEINYNIEWCNIFVSGIVFLCTGISLTSLHIVNNIIINCTWVRPIYVDDV